MKLYLAPTSSLELIRYLRAVNGSSGLEGEPVRKRFLNDAINTVRGINELNASAQFMLEHVNRPIHAFVPERAKGTNTNHLATHVFSQQIPNGAFLDLGNGMCLCTPQFTCMQLAAQLSFVELITVGMELCGSYAQQPAESAESSNASPRETAKEQSCTYHIPPVMSAKRFAAFVERMAGQRGAVGARRGLPWILDDSASPMETATYLLLCLPRSLGGYALPKPLLNPTLKISGPNGTTKRYPDLYWLSGNIDVEYNSDEGHIGERARYRDSKREIELVAADVRVLPLTRPQLMDAHEFHAFAQRLRRMLGVRSRPLGPEWEYRRDELRRMLLY